MIQRNVILKTVLFSFLPLCFWGCSKEEGLVRPDNQIEFITYSEEENSVGRMNAVKKAHQLTDLMFVPYMQIAHNNGFFRAGTSYRGMIYSSVKEIETYIGSNVSFHTFMTAINNPRSKMYTEQINAEPYHGINCKAYYGTVCSELVSYSLGILSPSMSTFDYPDSELMEQQETVVPENLQIADVLWMEGHVALITDVVKGEDGVVTEIEISEAIPPLCKRYYVTRQEFTEVVMSNFQRIYRYKEIGKNTDYCPINNWIGVEDNNALCVDKGDKSNYLEKEEVIINILNSDWETLEVYKDNNLLFKKKNDGLKDYCFDNLSWGDYKARIIINELDGVYSDYTCWKVVNAEVQYDRNSSKLYFNSMNSIPDYVICCKLNGLPIPLYEGFSHVFTEKEIKEGQIDVPVNLLNPSYPFIKVMFKTEYGRIIQKPITWVE